MRTIDSKNLDEWLFDHFEGNLKVEEKDTLTIFLHSNPALKSDYDAWKNSYINEPEMIYPGMDNLLKDEGFGKKWMKWGLSLFALTGLTAYLLYQNKEVVNTESTTTKTIAKPIEQLNPSTQNIPIDKSNNISLPVAKEKVKTIIQTTVPILDAKAVIEIEKTTPAIPDQVKIDPAIIQTENPVITENKAVVSDTAKTIPPNNSEKKDKKLKEKTKKEMKIIKLKNTGF